MMTAGRRDGAVQVPVTGWCDQYGGAILTLPGPQWTGQDRGTEDRDGRAVKNRHPQRSTIVMRSR